MTVLLAVLLGVLLRTPAAAPGAAEELAQARSGAVRAGKYNFLLPDLGEGVIRQLRDPDAADNELTD